MLQAPAEPLHPLGGAGGEGDSWPQPPGLRHVCHQGRAWLEPREYKMVRVGRPRLAPCARPGRGGPSPHCLNHQAVYDSAWLCRKQGPWARVLGRGRLEAGSPS